MAEGVPFHATLTDNELAALNTTLPTNVPAPLADTVTKIASAFDYDAEQTDARTFLLHKRYSDENDLPCVTYGEVVHSLHAMLTISDSFALAKPPVGSPDSVEYYYSLTGEQRARAKDGLGLADLTPEQREYAIGAAGYVCLSGRTIQLKQVYDHLVALKKPNTVFTWMNVHGVEAFGYEGPVGPLGYVGLRPLDNHYRLAGGAGFERIVKREKITKSITPNDTETHYVDAADPGPDPTDPTDLDRHLAAGMLVDRLPSTKTLAETAQAVMKMRMPKEDALPDVPLQVSVAPELADKPVCLYGPQYSTPEHLARSLAALYWLQVLVPREHRYEIALPIPRMPKTREEYTSEIKRMAPLPLLRQYAGLSATFAAAMPPYKQVSDDAPLSLERLQSKQQAMLSRNRNRAAIEALTAGYYPPARRLLVLAKPLVPTRDAPSVPVAKANPEVLRLLALALYSSACRGPVKQLTTKPLPVCVFDPERLCIKLDDSHPQGTSHLFFTFGYKDDDGVFHVEAQYSEATPYKPSKQ